jgi:hypothetical protein
MSPRDMTVTVRPSEWRPSGILIRSERLDEIIVALGRRRSRRTAGVGYHCGSRDSRGGVGCEKIEDHASMVALYFMHNNSVAHIRHFVPTARRSGHRGRRLVD